MCTTLIVEDNPVFREILREWLSCSYPDMAIEEALDSREALQKVEEFHPRLVFMDLRLPGASGFELTRRIRKKNNGATVVILTNSNFPEYKEAALRCGADYFFSKGSATGKELSRIVEDVLSDSPSEQSYA